MTEEQALAVALWVLLTWSIEAAEVAAYLDVSSPLRECGKTRLFETLELIVRAPRRCTGHTEATLFRMIESEHPTLLLDEIRYDVRQGSEALRRDPRGARRKRA